VRKAKEMGIETHCFAWEDGAVCKELADFFYPVSILEKEKILNICRQIGIDGITSIASDAAVPTMCYISDKLSLIGNSYEDALVATNKYQMRQRFIQNNVSSPKFVVANEGYTVSGFIFPLIVKPTDRSGSRGVKKVENLSDLQGAVQRAKNESFAGQAIIEEYITGDEVSVESISWEGKHYILAITDKVTTGEPYFVELEHHQPSQLSDEVQENIKTETIKALNALNVNYGASHSEFIITQEGKVYAIEVGARMGGDFIGSDLVRLSTGYDFVKAVIDVAFGQFETPQINEKNFSGVYFLCKETEHLMPIIKNKNHLIQIVESEITSNELHNTQCSADRSGYFIYQSNKRLKV
jgi:biotin carboxylase